jgi:tetratricopeptide (TPR) repeat protein
MNDDSIDKEKIEMLLRRLPEREVPPGLHERIMDTLPSGNRRQSIPWKLRSCWERLMRLAPMPMKAGAILAMTAAAFWLGTEVGSEKEPRNMALALEHSGMTPAFNDGMANQMVGTSLFEDENNYLSRDFFSKTTVQEGQSTAMHRWSDTFFRNTGDQSENTQNSNGTAITGADSVLFLLNLAHNLADSGNYHGALHQYEKVLRINPRDQTALYNRATSYHNLNDNNSERQAFIDYLGQYRSGRWACQAVDHLQRLGVFDYQISIIGGRKLVVNQTVLLGSQQQGRQDELKRLTTYLRRSSAGELHLVVFYQNDLEKSRAIAAELKRQINSILGEDRALPIKTSWFDEPAPVQTGTGEKRELETGLFLFTQPSTQQRSTI